MNDAPSDDFGFTTFDIDDIKRQSNSIEVENSELKRKNRELQEREAVLVEAVESIYDEIFPLLERLLSTADKPHIHWPNRQVVIGEMLKRIQAVKREALNA